MEKRGFSLVELLVVVAIIGILAAMYLAALSRARQHAVKTANMARMRDEGIGRMSGVSSGSREGAFQSAREYARSAFRENRGPGYGNGESIIVSRMLFVVSGDDTFRAYWHTLLNPANTAPLEYDGQRLKAKDKEGREFLLSPMDDAMQGRVLDASVPVEWEFLSTNPGDTSSGTIGSNVLYPDGHVQYMRYPGAFPMTRTVAELSHEFMK
jgi:prepilin-type N-terminal cleavage/methylation domain-containing protein/prepilin-type processing-associated H-X9-DG protein